MLQEQPGEMMARPSDRTGKTGSEELARMVRERREELGLSRQELADATGIPYPTVAQIETAYRGASPARLGVIARVLGLDPKELYEVLASEEAPVPEAPAAARVAAPRWHSNQRFAAAMPAPAPAAGSAPAADSAPVPGSAPMVGSAAGRRSRDRTPE